MPARGPPAAEPAGDGTRHLATEDIQEGQRGWCFRRLLRPWLDEGTQRVDIHEPWLVERGHREHLSWCLETLRTFGIQEARVFTCFPPDLPDERREEAAAALDSQARVQGNLGMHVAVQVLARFHRRSLVLHQSDGCIELTCDVGLHFWHPPRCDTQRTSLAARRTRQQRIVVMWVAEAPVGTGRDGPSEGDADALADQIPTSRRAIRRRLHEIDVLKRARGRGVLLHRAQAAKVSREGVLRHALATLNGLSSLTAGVFPADWTCGNPLCRAFNFGDRRACFQCGLVAAAGGRVAWAALRIQHAVRAWRRRRRASWAAAADVPAVAARRRCRQRRGARSFLGPLPANSSIGAKDKGAGRCEEITIVDDRGRVPEEQVEDLIVKTEGNGTLYWEEAGAGEAPDEGASNPLQLWTLILIYG